MHSNQYNNIFSQTPRSLVINHTNSVPKSEEEEEERIQKFQSKAIIESNQWVTLSLLPLILDIFQHPGSFIFFSSASTHTQKNQFSYINLFYNFFFCRAFSQKGLENLKSLFDSLASQSHSNGKYITPSVFQVSVFLDDLQFSD